MSVISTSRTLAVVVGSVFMLAACASGTTSPSFVDDSTGGYLAESVGDRVFFDTDRAYLDGGARETLRTQAEWLEQNDGIKLTIEGHADERGTREYNIALGARRASAVRDFLVGEGVSRRRLRTVSYGKERPVSLCSEESCWSQNRRSVSTVR